MDRRYWAGFLKIFLPVLLLIGGGGVVVVYTQYQQAVIERGAVQAASVGRAVISVETRFGRTLRDMVFLSRHAAIQSALNAPKPDSLSHIVHNFLAFSASQGVYDQIRWIDESGFERVRVDYNNGSPLEIPVRKLQDKSKRYYFTETMTLGADQIFVSPLDLNVENEVIERPFKPMIRVGMPLFDVTGKRRGMILLNYYGKDVIDGLLAALSGNPGQAMLLNQEGYWLHSPVSDDEWGFMLQRPETFATRYPTLWQTMNAASSGQLENGGDLWTWASVHPFRDIVGTVGSAGASVAKPYHWKIAIRVPSASVLASEKVTVRSVALYCLVLLIPGVIGSMVIARTRVLHKDAVAQAEHERMHESEARFELLLTSSTNGLLIVSDDGIVVRANNQTESMFGYPASTMAGMTVDDLVPSHIHSAHARYRHQYMAMPSARRLGAGRELSAKRRDGSEFPVEISLAPLRMQGETYVLVTVVDISERKRAELEIQTLNTGLEQRVRFRTEELAAANKELEAFAYAVSHDLRAPLRAMMGFSQALLEDCHDQLDDMARDYVDEIIRASRSMGALIEGLLTLSRSTQGILQRDLVDMSTLAHQIAHELQRADPQRRVEWHIEEGMTTLGDERMIQTVLQNLLSNAWKYTAHTANPLIRFYSSKYEDALKSGTGTRFFVSDNGAGFDMNHAGRLFKPFQRLHRQDEFAGIGIGLATVQRVVQRHGGTLDAVAEPERGATFSFSLGKEAFGTEDAQESY